MIQRRIEEKLQATFLPTLLRVTDESYLHVGHAGYMPGKASHFNIVIASPLFRGLSRLTCHRQVYSCLAEDLKGQVHALKLKTLCPEEQEALHEVG